MGFRLFEVIQKVREINAQRWQRVPSHVFSGSSSNDLELRANPALELDYIVAPPRMARYMEWSARIYQVYLRHVAPEDIHPYSIDEVFMDITPYLQTTGLAPWEFAKRVVKDVLDTTGITVTAGIGPNLYLCKAALDIVFKHIRPDKDGVRIARLNELSYRQLLWSHRPITDFWRVGPGYMGKGWQSTAFIRWGTSRAAPSAARVTCTMKTCSISCSGSMQSC